MSHPPKHGREHPHRLSLRSRSIPAALRPDEKRFDIFLIDTGWNGPVSKAVRAHLPVMYEYQKQDSLYLLTPEQSVEILKREPRLIGRDPAVVVYDLYGPGDRPVGNYRGFRLYLGRFKSAEQALARLQEFVRFINQNRTIASLNSEVRRELHREGLSGMVRVLREASEVSIELI